MRSCGLVVDGMGLSVFSMCSKSLSLGIKKEGEARINKLSSFCTQAVNRLYTYKKVLDREVSRFLYTQTTGPITITTYIK